MNDIGMIEDAVLAIGDFKGEPDRAKLYKDIKIIINKYGSLDMGQVDVAEFIQELLEVMKNNRIVMPHGLTMLARGITQIEGVLADIAPGINMVGIASARIKQEMFKNFDLKGELKSREDSIQISSPYGRAAGENGADTRGISKRADTHKF